MSHNTIAFTFGRFQPPGINHEKLLLKLVETSYNYKADHLVFISPTQNNKTDPLDWGFKRRICQAAFPGIKLSEDSNIVNPFSALNKLAENYDRIILVVGGDRYKDFKNNMTPYADKLGVQFKVVSAGKRDTLSEGIDGLSASKVRSYAINKEYDKFMESLPNSLSNSLKEMILRNTIRGLK